MAAADLRICLCQWMKRGVVITDPATVYILHRPPGPPAAGKGEWSSPSASSKGKTVIGKNCVIGPFARVRDCSIGDRVQHRAVGGGRPPPSMASAAAGVGPWTRRQARLRGGRRRPPRQFLRIQEGQDRQGRQGRPPELPRGHPVSLRQGANIGAGTITANYDGKESAKHPTRIGRKASGSDREPVLVAAAHGSATWP